MLNCPTCQSTMGVSELHCDKCSINLKGQFTLPRLARLSRGHQQLAEDFLALGGNLKLLAEQMQISYPTLRRRVDDMITELKTIRDKDRNRAEEILIAIEQGKMTAQEGLRLIRDMNNERI